MSIQTFIQSLLLVNNRTITPTIQSEIANHVNSILYSTLTNPMINSTTDESMTIINNNRSKLNSLLSKYENEYLNDCWFELMENLLEMMDSAIGFE
jgi:hypothetical protein